MDITNYSNQLVEQITWKDIISITGNMFHEIQQLNGKDKTQAYYDMFKLWALKRECHTGIGDGLRDTSYKYLLTLAIQFPKTVREIILEKMITKYGTWKDIRNIIKTIHTIQMTKKEKITYFNYFVVEPLRVITMEMRNENLYYLNEWVRKHMHVNLYDISAEELYTYIQSHSMNLKDLNIPYPLLGKYLVSEKGGDNKKAYWFVPSGMHGKYEKISLVNYLIQYPHTYPSRKITSSILRTYRQENSKLRIAINSIKTQDYYDNMSLKTKFIYYKTLLNKSTTKVGVSGNASHLTKKEEEHKDYDKRFDVVEFYRPLIQVIGHSTEFV
jgi:hypothetical protein